MCLLRTLIETRTCRHIQTRRLVRYLIVFAKNTDRNTHTHTCRHIQTHRLVRYVTVFAVY